MKSRALLNQTRGRVIAGEVRLCRSFGSRLKGLIGTADLADDAAYWLDPCNAVHTLAMRYPIDVYFLDRHDRIVFILQNLGPNRFSPLIWKARSVIELKSGIAREAHVGDQLKWESAS